MAQCSACLQEYSYDQIITDAAEVPVAKVGGEKRSRDAEAELMKGPLTVQVPINGITNEVLGGCPHTSRGSRAQGLQPALQRRAFKSRVQADSAAWVVAAPLRGLGCPPA